MIITKMGTVLMVRVVVFLMDDHHNRAERECTNMNTKQGAILKINGNTRDEIIYYKLKIKN